MTSPVPYPTAAMTAWRDRTDPVGALIRRLADANAEGRRHIASTIEPLQDDRP